MANNYLQFSFAVPDITDAEKEWLEPLIAGDDDHEALIALIDADDYLEFRAEVDEDGLWIYAEENGSAEQAAAFVQAFLAAHRPFGVVGFEWAMYCDRPRLDEFGGGAVVITAAGCEWLTTFGWMEGKIAELKAEGPYGALAAELRRLDPESLRVFLAERGVTSLIELDTEEPADHLQALQDRIAVARMAAGS